MMLVFTFFFPLLLGRCSRADINEFVPVNHGHESDGTEDSDSDAYEFCYSDNTTCSAVCSGEYACGSVSGGLGEGWNITCPTSPDCSYCELYCEGKESCRGATLDGQLCSVVNVTIDDADSYGQGQYLTIIAPGNEGILTVHVENSQEFAFANAQILSSPLTGGTDQIVVNCNSDQDSDCSQLEIDASYVNHVELNCSQNSQCDDTYIYSDAQTATSVEINIESNADFSNSLLEGTFGNSLKLTCYSQADCRNVSIIADTYSSGRMMVNAGSKALLTYTQIVMSSDWRLTINCWKAAECSYLYVDAQDANYLRMNCLEKSDCSLQNIVCPIESSRENYGDQPCVVYFENAGAISDNSRSNITVSGSGWQDDLSISGSCDNDCRARVFCNNGEDYCDFEEGTCYGGCQPSVEPTEQPTANPSTQPSRVPSQQPSDEPSGNPTVTSETVVKSVSPTRLPSADPTELPSINDETVILSTHIGEMTEMPSSEPSDVLTGPPSSSQTSMLSTQGTHLSTKPTATPSEQSPESGQGGAEAESDDDEEEMDTTQLIGIIVGVCITCLLCGVVAFCLIRKQRQENEKRAIALRSALEESRQSKTGMEQIASASPAAFGMEGDVKATGMNSLALPEAVATSTPSGAGEGGTLGNVQQGEGANMADNVKVGVLEHGEKELMEDEEKQVEYVTPGAPGGDGNGDDTDTSQSSEAEMNELRNQVVAQSIAQGVTPGGDNNNNSYHANENSVDMGVALAELMQEKDRRRTKSLAKLEAQDAEFGKILSDNLMAVDVAQDEIVQQMNNDREGNYDTNGFTPGGEN